MTLHAMLDTGYGTDGADVLRRMLGDGADPNERDDGALAETPLHVATRRRRRDAVQILLEHGADADAENAGGKTAYAHALRRGFHEIADLLRERGARTTLNDADRLAVAVVNGRLDEARAILAEHPGAARTGNNEEDRLLADVAGGGDRAAVALLIAAGADLTAPALDGGTPLHQAAWFGQPENARLLLDAGAPIDAFDPVHESAPIGWAVHGSRYSGGASERQDVYVEIVRLLLTAGASLGCPGGGDDAAYRKQLLSDATPRVRAMLESA